MPCVCARARPRVYTVYGSPCARLSWLCARADIVWFYAAFAALLGDAFGAQNTDGRMCALVFLFVGNVVFAMLFGEVLMALAASTASRDMYAGRMAGINEAMRDKRVPPWLRKRVGRYYEFLWLVHGAAANEDDPQSPMEWMYELPAPLRVAINLAQHRDMLKRCFSKVLSPSAFSKFENKDVLVRLAQRLTYTRATGSSHSAAARTRHGVGHVCVRASHSLWHGCVPRCAWFAGTRSTCRTISS